MTTDRPLTLRLDRSARGDAIAGWLSDQRGEHYFAGWLGLLTLLERARATAVSDGGDAPKEASR